MLTSLILVLVLGVMLGLLLFFIDQFRSQRQRRLDAMDDSDPGHEEWRFGTPNDPIPEDALKWDPLQPDDTCCQPIRKVKFNAEED